MYELKNDFLMNEVSEKFDIISSTVDSDQIHMKVKLNTSNHSNDLIHYLSTKGTISKFSEVIPNANDIFMKAIKQNADK